MLIGLFIGTHDSTTGCAASFKEISTGCHWVECPARRKNVDRY